jgi:AraC family transcriptional regulator
MASHLHMDSAPAITVNKLKNSLLAVTRLRSDAALAERTTPIPPEQALAVSLHLRAASGAELWYGGRSERVGPHRPEGAVSIIDLEREPAVYIGSAFDMVQFYVPRPALVDIAQDHDAPRIDNLSWPFGQVDATVQHMTLSIFPVLERPELASGLYVDHVVLGLVSYFAYAYGGMRVPESSMRGGLAPWQERRAKEMLSANLDGEISLAELASECELSRSHFARAFKRCTGTSPHRWLLERRVETAKDLLLESDRSIVDIALACGFADQSHLTRVFSNMVGKSPGAWRRAQKH